MKQRCQEEKRVTFRSSEGVQSTDGEAGEPGGLVLLLLLLGIVNHHGRLGDSILFGVADEDLVRHCGGDEKELLWS